MVADGTPVLVHNKTPCVPGQVLGDTSKVPGWVPTSIPPESLAVIRDIERYGVEAQGAGGQRAGPTIWETFDNIPRNGGYKLPEFDGSGKPITYRELGTVQSAANPRPGGERIVAGSDGSIYYSPTHYQTFNVAKPGKCRC